MAPPLDLNLAPTQEEFASFLGVTIDELCAATDAWLLDDNAPAAPDWPVWRVERLASEAPAPSVPLWQRPKPETAASSAAQSPRVPWRPYRQIKRGDLNDMIADIARRLLGSEADTRGGQLRFRENQALSVETSGPNKGTFYDHQDEHGGGPIELIQHINGGLPGVALDWLRSEFGIEIEYSGSGSGWNIEATYDYLDEAGVLLYQKLRFVPKSFRQRRPDPAAKGGWNWKLGDVRRVLYNTPDLVARPTETVFGLEGEKDCDNGARKLGILTTCNGEGGSKAPSKSGKKWRPEYSEQLRGRDVVVIPDNDAVGRGHAQTIARALIAVWCTVRVVSLPGEINGKAVKDLSDWIAAGGTREQLDALVAAAPLVEIAEPAQAAGAQEGGAEGGTKTDEQPVEKKITINTKAPFDNAKGLLRRNYTVTELRTLHRHRAGFYQWVDGAYRAVTDEDIRARLYEDLAKCWEYDKELKLDLVSPDQKMVTEHADALRAAAYLNDAIEAPAWLGEEPTDTPADEIVSLENGLLHLPSKSQLKHTPAYFTYNVLPFDYQPGALCPQWLEFLNQLWPNDPVSIQTLREIFGLCLTKDTKFQKMFLILGPRRCGKGTIGRILRAMLGAANVCSPTLGSLSGEFGLQSLIGKLVAIISDARMTAKTDSDAVAERLLNISGEDAIDVNRKNTTFWHGQLMVRVIMLANGLPRFNDASGAFAGRFIVLRIVPSFYGNEDLGLTKRLMTELPGILNWAIGGWESVTERGHFEQPESASGIVRQMEDMASPVSVFMREECKIGGGIRVAKKALYAAWCGWCEGQGRQPGNNLTFAKNLREALPGLGEVRPRPAAQPGEPAVRTEYYTGIALKDAPRGAGDPNDPRGPWWQKD
jgi:putative DNA primase/helicase